MEAPASLSTASERPPASTCAGPSPLRRLLVAGRFDVLHAHLPYTAAFGRLVDLTVPRALRPVVVYTEHSLWNKAAVLTKALNRSTVGVDRALIVVSVAARGLARALRGRARVVVHGVDRTRFAALRAGARTAT